VQIVPLRLTDVSFPRGHPLEGETGPVRAFLVIHDAGALLVDTGVGRGNAEVDQAFEPRHASLDDALASHGAGPGDVTAVVNSHLHFDHAGQNGLFRGVPIFVQRAEREAAVAADYTIPEWIDFPGSRYELLDGDAEIAPGVRVIATPGHTPGHQSVLVSEGRGPALIAAQAVYSRAEWEGATDPRRSGLPSAWDRAAYADSVSKLRALGPRVVYFSHDSAAWERAGEPK
jgi:glyoxylase-like metal-dependent hydrolase (beta-lactamase superfamily II)